MYFFSCRVRSLQLDLGVVRGALRVLDLGVPVLLARALVLARLGARLVLGRAVLLARVRLVLLVLAARVRRALVVLVVRVLFALLVLLAGTCACVLRGAREQVQDLQSVG